MSYHCEGHGYTHECAVCLGEELRADLARAMVERDDARAAYMDLMRERNDMHSRAEAAEKELRNADYERNQAESRLAEVEAQAAAMRSALEMHMSNMSAFPHEAGVCVGCSYLLDTCDNGEKRNGDEHTWCPCWHSRRALSGDAGRATLDELVALRRVRDAADGYRALQRSGYGTGDDHVVELALIAVSLDAALDAAKAVGK